MPLLKNNTLVPETWLHTSADGELPAGDVVVPFARLLKEWEQLSKRPGKLGVSLGNVDRAEALAMFLPKLQLIELPFPAFNDGRAYSIARQLRQMGYRGELRATGNVLPDQLQFMLQVGFRCLRHRRTVHAGDMAASLEAHVAGLSARPLPPQRRSRNLDRAPHRRRTLARTAACRLTPEET